MPSRFLKEVPGELIEPADEDSARALEGEIELKREVPGYVREKVEGEYEEYGEGWTVLPRAYKWAEMQGGGSPAKVAPRPEGSRVSKSREATPQEPSKYAVGETVEHPTFGVGRIVKIQPAGGNDHFLQINFEKEGQKLLSEQKAPLKKVEG